MKYEQLTDKQKKVVDTFFNEEKVNEHRQLIERLLRNVMTIEELAALLETEVMHDGDTKSMDINVPSYEFYVFQNGEDKPTISDEVDCWDDDKCCRVALTAVKEDDGTWDFCRIADDILDEQQDDITT